MLRYDAPAQVYAEVEESTGYVPWASNWILSNNRARRATVDYWTAAYQTLVESQPVEVESDEEVALQFVAANATYRLGEREADCAAAVRQLEAAIKGYTSVLKASAEHPDAAYNYEFLIRTRNDLARGRRRSAPGQAAGGARTASVVLPSGHTLHGDAGAPPKNAAAESRQFKIHVPMVPEEQPNQEQAGQGKPKVRRG